MIILGADIWSIIYSWFFTRMYKGVYGHVIVSQKAGLQGCSMIFFICYLFCKISEAWPLQNTLVTVSMYCISWRPQMKRGASILRNSLENEHKVYVTLFFPIFLAHNILWLVHVSLFVGNVFVQYLGINMSWFFKPRSSGCRWHLLLRLQCKVNNLLIWRRHQGGKLVKWWDFSMLKWKRVNSYVLKNDQGYVFLTPTQNNSEKS